MGKRACDVAGHGHAVVEKPETKTNKWRCIYFRLHFAFLHPSFLLHAFPFRTVIFCLININWNERRAPKADRNDTRNETEGARGADTAEDEPNMPVPLKGRGRGRKLGRETTWK